MNIKQFTAAIFLITSIIANPVYALEFLETDADTRASSALTQHLNFPTPAASNVPLPRQDASPELATVYYVDAINGSNATGDGTASAPWRTITFALSQVTGPNIEIRVASGVYNQTLGESFPITMEPGVSLVGADYATTIIEGSGSGSLVYFPSTTIYTETTVLSGFKITQGTEGVRVEGYATTSGSSPTIQGNWITGNTYGIYNVTASSRRAYPAIKGNHISNNTSYGIYNSAGYTRAYANPVIEENQIVNNGSSGIFCYAAASSGATSYCSPLVKGNLISGNGGNGVTCHTYYAGSCSPQLVGNIVANNNGWGVGRAHEGTPLAGSNPVFVNNLFYGNSSGGTIFKTGLDTPTFVNNTIVYNNS